MVNVVIKNHKGETLKVEDSKENIEIKIPRKVHSTEEEDESLFIKPSSEGKMQHHKVYVGDENTVRLKVSMVYSPELLGLENPKENVLFLLAIE